MITQIKNHNRRYISNRSGLLYEQEIMVLGGSGGCEGGNVN